jgi:3-dehydroquinate dehydratase
MLFDAMAWNRGSSLDTLPLFPATLIQPQWLHMQGVGVREAFLRLSLLCRFVEGYISGVGVLHAFPTTLLFHL